MAAGIEWEQSDSSARELRASHFHILITFLIIVCAISFRRVVRWSSCRWKRHVVLGRCRSRCSAAILCLQLRNAVFKITNIVDGGLDCWHSEITIGRRMLTCRIANLCISPVQAGIMLFRTPNSSFIFDLRRRSIKLCAVLRAIFRPATLVADGCFFLFEVAGPALAVGPLATSPSMSRSCSCCPRGFICIIFRERVGGGGKVKTSFALFCAAEERRRAALCKLVGDTAADLGEAG
jgi:hypothetical protein